MKTSTVKQKAMVLSMLQRLCKTPQALVEIYPLALPVGMGSGPPLKKSRESILHNSQRDRMERMEQMSILYCFGVLGPVETISTTHTTLRGWVNT
jgi:hypothetical protein